jgi:hypothetical protein
LVIIGDVDLEFNILIPFIIAATIPFMAITMCVVLMIDVKVKKMNENIAKITDHLVNSQPK